MVLPGNTPIDWNQSAWVEGSGCEDTFWFNRRASGILGSTSAIIIMVTVTTLMGDVMARPLDPMAAVPVMTRVSVDMAQRLRSIAAAENVSVAEIVRGLLRDQLDVRAPERAQLAISFGSEEQGRGAA